MTDAPIAVDALSVPPRPRRIDQPEPFGNRLAGRERRVLGDLFGLKNFGVNLTRLEPGAISSLRHAHSAEEEFIYVVEGHPTLVTNSGDTELAPGMCAGFRPGTGDAHHLVNRTGTDVLYLEIGERRSNDTCIYPDDSLHTRRDANGVEEYVRADGTTFRP